MSIDRQTRAITVYETPNCFPAARTEVDQIKSYSCSRVIIGRFPYLISSVEFAEVVRDEISSGTSNDLHQPLGE